MALRYIGKQSGPTEEPFFWNRTTALEHFSAFTFTNANIFINGFQLTLRIDGTDIGVLIQRITNY